MRLGTFAAAEVNGPIVWYLPSCLGTAHSTLIGQNVFARLLTPSHQHAGEVGRVVDSSCRAIVSSGTPYAAPGRWCARHISFRTRVGSWLTDKQLGMGSLACRQRADIVVALRCHLVKGMIEIRQHRPDVVVGSGEQHSLHLQLERTGARSVSVILSSLACVVPTSLFCGRMSGRGASNTRHSSSPRCLNAVSSSLQCERRGAYDSSSASLCPCSSPRSRY